MYYVISEGHGDKLVNDKEYDVRMHSEGGKVLSRSKAYETVAKCLEGEEGLKELCLECGNIVTTHYVEPTKTRLIEGNICFHCDHWVEWEKRKDDPRVARIEGGHYRYSDPTDKGFRGFGGRKFVIQFDDGRLIESSNLWFQGDIPDRFRERLPDNAKFVQQ